MCNRYNELLLGVGYGDKEKEEEITLLF